MKGKDSILMLINFYSVPHSGHILFETSFCGRFYATFEMKVTEAFPD